MRILLDITIPVPGKSIIRLIPDYYTKTLGLPYYSRFDDSVFPSAPLIWGSWTAYYYEARESDIVSNTDWLAENLKPYGFQYVQLDDGYDRGKEEGITGLKTGIKHCSLMDRNGWQIILNQKACIPDYG